MRLAVVFDDLIQFGGAERLLLAVHELYPEAPVYTSLASNEWFKRCRDLKIELRTTFMQKLPLKNSLNRFYGLLGIHALAFEFLRLDDFEIVLSISARFSHAVNVRPGTVHICYMNSPGRMFWDPRDYFEREGLLRNFLARKVFWIFSSPFLAMLRLGDYVSAQKVDYFIANSRTAQQRIRKYYGQKAKIIYPFFDMTGTGTELAFPITAGAHYLVITRLNAWKRVDIAIEACRKVGVKLIIIGEGPDRKRLDYVAAGDKNIQLLGFVDESQKVSIIKNCRALIITQKEDFGITALEAMSLGKPVIASRTGGAMETVIEGVTGDFYPYQNATSLAKILAKFDPLRYKASDCIDQSNKFSKQRFMLELDAFIKKVYHSKNNLP